MIDQNIRGEKSICKSLQIDFLWNLKLWMKYPDKNSSQTIICWRRRVCWSHRKQSSFWLYFHKLFQTCGNSNQVPVISWLSTDNILAADMWPNVCQKEALISNVLALKNSCVLAESWKNSPVLSSGDARFTRLVMYMTTTTNMMRICAPCPILWSQCHDSKSTRITLFKVFQREY